jgi:hypothetical protein
MNQLPEFLTLRQTAADLGLALATVRMYAWAKILPATKIGVQYFVSKADLAAFKAKR